MRNALPEGSRHEELRAHQTKQQKQQYQQKQLEETARSRMFQGLRHSQVIRVLELLDKERHHHH
jgi:hypothetical protein